MDTNREKIEELTRRINELAKQQTTLSRDLVQLINELEILKKQVTATETVQEKTGKVPDKIIEFRETIEPPVTRPVQQAAPVQKKTPAAGPATTFEEFVGKNLASKIGILVTIVGVFIGAKYAIEHNLVSPLVRIINGYLSGIVLIAIAIRLKKKYEGYSAVLMGGGIAVLYFITYIAYSFYLLIPQTAAFAQMLVFTAGAVYASLVYNRVIIAHLGLVGAYAIPFLLSDNTGRYEILFSYIAIINIGILILSFRKYWKSLFYAAYIVTWIIYLAWIAFTYYYKLHFELAAVFLCIYFLTFYGTFLAYKLVKKEQYGFGDVAILLSNAFIFYGTGYGLLSRTGNMEEYRGLFTVINALLHLAISQLIRRLKLADKALYFFVLGLVIVFLTIAIPVQLDGNWVTLLWTAEAVLVIIIGLTQKAPAYSKLGVGLTTLSFFSLLQDWFVFYGLNDLNPGTPHSLIINSTFLTGILVLLAQGTVIYFHHATKYRTEKQEATFFTVFYSYIVPAMFLFTGYFVFQMEISGYFRHINQLVHGADGSFDIWDSEVNTIAFITNLLYSMIFVTIITLVNRRWINSKALASFNVAGMVIILLLLLTLGLPALHELTFNYNIKNGNGLYFGTWNLLARYIVMAFTAVLLYLGRQSLQQHIQLPALNTGWALFTQVVVLGLLTSEYLHWTTFSNAGNQFKLGLSILWGIYALFMVITGIWKKRKYLRLGAIVLFSIILIKLFFYDLAEAGTITKTVSFISLGTILLLVSYLYNRYKEVLFGGEETGK